MATIQLKGLDQVANYLQNNQNAQISNVVGGRQLAMDPRIQQMLQQQQDAQAAALKAQQDHEAQYSGLGGFLRGAVEGLADPFVRLGRVGDVAINDLIGHNDYARQQQSKYFGEDSQLGSELLRGLTGVGSFLVPGGAGLKAGLALGGLSGLLGGVSQTNLSDGISGDDLTKILTGGAFGAATGGVLNKLFPGANQAVGAVEGSLDSATPSIFGSIANKLDDQAEGGVMNAFKREIGGNAPKSLGGARFESELMNFIKGTGAKVKSADDLVGFADNVLQDFGPRVGQYTDELTQQGLQIPVSEVLGPLDAKIAAARTPQVKNPLLQARDSFIEATGGLETISPTDLYKLKQEFGQLGPFNPAKLTADPNVGAAFETLYRSSNKSLDDIFKSTGNTAFRETNKAVEMATKAKQWANDVSLKARPGATLNDMTQDAMAFGGLAAGGPVGAGAGLAASKFFGSPSGERALAGLYKGGAGAARLLDKGVSLAKSGIGNLDNIINQPGVKQGIRAGVVSALPDSGMQDNNLQLTPLQQQLLPFLQEPSGGEDPLQAQMTGMKQSPAANMSPIEKLNAAGMVAQQMGFKADANTVMKLADMLFPTASASQGRPLPAKTVENLSGMEYAMSQLAKLSDDIQGEYASRFGPVQGGALGNIAEGLGIDSSVRAEIRSRTETLAQLIGKAFEGGKLGDQDIKRYREMLPNLSDNPEQALGKIKSAIAAVQAQYETQLRGLERSGYAINGGGMPSNNLNLEELAQYI